MRRWSVDLEERRVGFVAQFCNLGIAREGNTGKRRIPSKLCGVEQEGQERFAAENRSLLGARVAAT